MYLVTMMEHTFYSGAPVARSDVAMTSLKMTSFYLNKFKESIFK